MTHAEYMRTWRLENVKRRNEEAYEKWIADGFKEIQVKDSEVSLGESAPKRRTHYRAHDGTMKAFVRLKKMVRCPICGKKHTDYNLYCNKYEKVGKFCYDCATLRNHWKKKGKYQQCKDKRGFLKERIKEIKK